MLFLSGADNPRTKDFPYSGSLKSVCVPAGTDRLFVDATGGAGGGGGRGYGGIGTGGSGSHVLAVVPVTAGTQVGLKVGKFDGGGGGWGDGTGGGRDDAPTLGAKNGGGGGGSSAVKSTSATCTAKPRRSPRPSTPGATTW